MGDRVKSPARPGRRGRGSEPAQVDAVKVQKMKDSRAGRAQSTAGLTLAQRPSEPMRSDRRGRALTEKWSNRSSGRRRRADSIEYDQTKVVKQVAGRTMAHLRRYRAVLAAAAPLPLLIAVGQWWPQHPSAPPRPFPQPRATRKMTRNRRRRPVRDKRYPQTPSGRPLSRPLQRLRK